MAIKRYPTRYVKSYLYKDPHSGEEEDIVFMANGYLFPLFKSCTGVELGQALSDYKKGLLTVVNKETVDLIGKFEAAKTPEEKMQVVTENPELLISTIKQAQETDELNGLSMIEWLLIIMRVCALPQNDHAEALAAGYEILPQEVYEDPTLALELLNMAMDYEAIAKKKLKIPEKIKKKAANKDYGLTSYLLYSLAQLGFKVDIMQYGMNVIMDVINMSVDLHDRHKGGGTQELIDLSEPLSMEG